MATTSVSTSVAASVTTLVTASVKEPCRGGKESFLEIFVCSSVCSTVCSRVVSCQFVRQSPVSSIVFFSVEFPQFVRQLDVGLFNSFSDSRQFVRQCRHMSRKSSFTRKVRIGA